MKTEIFIIYLFTKNWLTFIQSKLWGKFFTFYYFR